ncbi:LOW QUALITY PROTEIN: hypothetical protein BJ085DRAFT_42353 [Dimargaris cristalligena]|uniref:JmjC domain-containing protein n=1 Tax=Dimargaris cristalligena TaxID=215637 RepID=A0A4P9ZNX5_9FUNG|nr:LOW QUALITY PROTEIN: hypothetical protein BJ085DRAFT_42353 [Dimargaris cristalligena]|eukprot:RKP35013.1 LOW QUALITY PROTEIN: hypothetical protein BJ085DRAFT_42353 [Dimargaris cristalligena]
MPGEQLTYAPTLRCWRFELKIDEWVRFKFASHLETTQDAIPRIANNQVNEQEFIDYFQAPNTQLPVMITGATGAWPAAERWATLERLETRFGNKKFKVGEDDDEHNAYLKFRYFIRCVREDVHRDDSPLYRFDCNLKDTQRNTGGGLASKAELLHDFVVPKYFREDLFYLMGRPAQTGTGFHFNPLGTSAWNSLLVTRKRWALFPPRTPRELVDPPSMEAFDREVTSWFYHVLPNLIGIVEGLHHPGETIYVPGGRQRVVINLDSTVATTQDICAPMPFDYIEPKTRLAWPGLAAKLECELKARRENRIESSE